MLLQGSVRFLPLSESDQTALISEGGWRKLGRAHELQSGPAEGVTVQMWPDECVLFCVGGSPGSLGSASLLETPNKPLASKHRCFSAGLKCSLLQVAKVPHCRLPSHTKRGPLTPACSNRASWNQKKAPVGSLCAGASCQCVNPLSSVHQHDTGSTCHQGW